VAFFECAGTRLFYQDVGRGPAILTTHGLAENHLYWSLPGIAAALVEAGYRVISLDMRGHGRSTQSEGSNDFHIDAIAHDIGALADHLQLKRFHLLTHATGGMAGLRFAMAHPSRLITLISTNTGSATIPTDAAAAVTDPDLRIDVVVENVPRNMSRLFRNRTWVEIIQGAKTSAPRDPFLNSMHRAANPAAAFAWYETCSRLGDPNTLADFIDAFYTDPDPRIAQLRLISCPCLVVTAEHDRMFLEPSKQLAREIPNAKLVVVEGRGHMLAFEDPERLSSEILGFLESVASH